jgi:hypothetical protein
LTPQQKLLSQCVADLKAAQEHQAAVGLDELAAATPQQAAAARAVSLQARDRVVAAAVALSKAEASGVRSANDAVHTTAAQRLLALCRENAGIYVKMVRQCMNHEHASILSLLRLK